MSDQLRSFLQSEVVKEEIFLRHKLQCGLPDTLTMFNCNCEPTKMERIVIERPVGLEVEARKAEIKNARKKLSVEAELRRGK